MGVCVCVCVCVCVEISNKKTYFAASLKVFKMCNSNIS